jgi:hypothetical protein
MAAACNDGNKTAETRTGSYGELGLQMHYIGKEIIPQIWDTATNSYVTCKT